MSNKKKEYQQRLKFINEDVKRLIESLSNDVLNMSVYGNYENVNTLLSNIEIASNLKDDESLNWVVKNGEPTDEYIEFFHKDFGIEMGAKNINDSRIILRINEYDGDNEFILSIKEYVKRGDKLSEKQIMGSKRVFKYLDNLKDDGIKKEKDIDKMPNQKWHQIVSFIKSGVRIIGYCFIPFNLIVATILLVLSEIIGILEEMV
jgi:hypothetical protein